MIWLFLLLTAQTTVENGLKPKKPLKLELAKELSLGSNTEDDAQIFSVGATFAVDEKDIIYVLDPGNFRVAVFDGQGKLIRQFGKQGQGPGEFQTPSDIGLTHDGHLAVFDTTPKKMNVYDKEGNYLREVSFSQGILALTRPFFFENGNVMFFSVQADAQFRQYYDVSLYDAELKPVKTLNYIALPQLDWSQSANPDFWVQFLKTQFEALVSGAPVGAAIDGKSLVSARANAYKGDIMRPDGTVISSFTKEYKPKPFTDEAKYVAFEGLWQSMISNPFLANNMPKPVFEKAVSATEIPPSLLPFVGLFQLGNGFGVMANYDVINNKGDVDVFDREGHHLGTAAYEGPINPLVGTKTHLYAGGNDDDGNVVVVKYRVKGL